MKQLDFPFLFPIAHIPKRGGSGNRYKVVRVISNARYARYKLLQELGIKQ